MSRLAHLKIVKTHALLTEALLQGKAAAERALQQSIGSTERLQAEAAQRHQQVESLSLLLAEASGAATYWQQVAADALQRLSTWERLHAEGCVVSPDMLEMPLPCRPSGSSTAEPWGGPPPPP